MAIILTNQDALLTITPMDQTGGPITLTAAQLASLTATSSNAAAFDNGVLDPADQSDPGRVAFTMRAVQHGNAGDQAAWHVTVGDIMADTEVATINAEGPTLGSLGVTVTAIPKVV